MAAATKLDERLCLIHHAGPSKASALQITANRRNALKSTGPQTRSGKAASRMNALKHGLTAEQVVLFDEDVEEFQRFFPQMGTGIQA
jgi:hypothetical protein